MNEREAYLTLALTPHIGPISFAAILRRFPQPSAALNASHQDLSPCLEMPQKAWSALQENKAKNDVQAALNWEQQEQCRIMTLWDDDYPLVLAEGMAAPPLLFLRGNTALLKNTMVAIVGSRKATTPALHTAESWAKNIASVGVSIVSGFADGIDSAAHKGALAEIGSTIAVLGNGIDRVYPACNHALAHQIAQNGLLLSEFPLGSAPVARNFPRRNRIIAGLSQATVVIEAALKSGSLITARLAGELGKDVMAMPGSIANPLARGCHKLIQEGAKLVQFSQEILDELSNFNTSHQKKATKLDQSPQKKDDAPEKAIETHPILKEMGFDPVHPDTLAEKLNQDTGEILAQLLELELAGLINTAAGGFYQRI